MAYRCLDCSHKAATFPGGECTACGSRNVRRTGKRAIEMRGEARKPYRLALSIALWIYLAFRLLEILFS